MKLYFKNLKDSFSVSGIVTLFIGLMLLIYPDFTNTAICYLISAVLIFKGASGIVDKYINKETTLFPFENMWNVLLCAMGILVAARSEVIISVIPIVCGLFLLMSGVTSLQKALSLKQMGYEKWSVNLLFTVIKIVLAALMLLYPFGTALTLTRFIGGCLVYDGLSGLVTVFEMIKAKNAAEKAADELRALNLEKNTVKEDIPVVQAEIVTDYENK